MHRRRAFFIVMTTAAYTCVAGTVAVRAQQAYPSNEITVIRDSEALEARGDIAGAEKLVRSVLVQSPTSLSSLIILERLLTSQGRLAELGPFLDRLLQADPLSVIGHLMRVRMYATTNQPAELQRAGEAWIAATPDIETPYREIARAYTDRGDGASAAAVLDRGRKKLGGNALALELGDVYAQMNDYDRAVVEWSRGIGRNGEGLLPVQRRLQAMPDGGASAIPKLVAALRHDPATLDRKRAAANIAIDAGMRVEAEQLAREVYKQLPSKDRPLFLIDVARHADANGLSQLAYWAYGEAVRVDTDSTRALALRSRYAQIALIVGDTARASKMFNELERAAVAGSPQRRQALAARIQLSASRGDLEHASADLASLRAEYPAATELDEAASQVANAMLDKGRTDDAEAAVVGINGPRSGAARGRVYLRRGDVEKARNEILASAPSLHGAEATEALRLATLIARMSNAGGEVIGRALALVNDDAAGAVQLLMDGSKRLDPNERADILDYAAAVADRANLAEQATLVRKEIVAQYPKSTVAPAALLALAQAIVRSGGPGDDARLLLERIILEYPRSALVPQARRDLDRLLGRVPGG